MSDAQQYRVYEYAPVFFFRFKVNIDWKLSFKLLSLEKKMLGDLKIGRWILR